MAASFRILTLNNIAQIGLGRLPPERYEVGGKIDDPDAILVRSQDMHAFAIGPRVRAIARAGAGTNNIPVKAMSGRGVPVFNAPTVRKIWPRLITGDDQPAPGSACFQTTFFVSDHSSGRLVAVE